LIEQSKAVLWKGIHIFYPQHQNISLHHEVSDRSRFERFPGWHFTQQLHIGLLLQGLLNHVCDRTS
jgi:hypothetical protein